MLIYDRFSPSKKPVQVSSLPDHIELGRYYIVDKDGKQRDLTDSIIDLGTEKQILQDLLSSNNDSTQQLFNQFYSDITDNTGEMFEVIPLIQEVTKKVPLNSFEEMLRDNLFHLEEIIRQPHFLLTRYVEKVNISRAKRVSNKSYQYLASHTEDWRQKSVVSFKPNRILNEELYEYYDIYENQIFSAFLSRTFRYLGARIEQLNHITKLLEDRENLRKKLFDNRNDEKGWYKKIHRNLTLIGKVFSRGSEDDSGELAHSNKAIAENTREVLLGLQRRVMVLMSSELVKMVNRVTVQNLMTESTVKATNVTTNHKHYRYIRDLWLELNHYQKEETEEERQNYEQDVIQGVRDYAKAAIRYSVERCLDYDIEGDYNHWRANKEDSPSIIFKEHPDKTFSLSVGEQSTHIVVVASNLSDGLKSIPSDTVVLFYPGKDVFVDDYHTSHIAIDPYQVDSVERIGKMVKTMLIVNLVATIHRSYKYPSKLLPYLEYIHQDFLEFDTRSFDYSFIRFPERLQFDPIGRSMDSNKEFANKKYSERLELKERMKDLVDDINTEGELIKGTLRCPDCSTPYSPHNNTSLTYLQCDCEFVLNIRKSEICFFNVNAKYKDLRESDWGMDYIRIETNA